MINKGIFVCIFTEAAASPGKQQNLNSPEKAGNNFLLKGQDQHFKFWSNFE